MMTAETTDGARFAIYRHEWSDDVPSAVRARVRHDIRRLSEFQHELWQGPVDSEFDEQGGYIVCPQSLAGTLADQLNSGLSVTDALSIAVDLLEILEDLHEAGLVLRSFGPDCIYVKETGGNLRASLGGCPPLVHLSGAHQGNVCLETLTYSAPEVLGALDYDIRPPADLYSVGMVLFTCLAGHPPFKGTNARELLFHHVTTPVPDLCVLNEMIPPELNDVVRRLLQKHPRDRYQSAVGTRHDLVRIRERLISEPDTELDVSLVLGTRDRRESLIEPAYVGRDHETSIVQNAVDAVLAGNSQSILVRAPSGVGKSRLLQEVSTAALTSGFRVLSGQGANCVGLTPLATLQPALEAALELIRNDAKLQECLHSQLADYGRELDAAAPEIAEELQLEVPDERNHELSDRRIAVAIATLLGRLSCAGQPVLLLIDDAQWADDLTLATLECWSLTKPADTLLVVSSRPSDRLTRRLQSNMTLAAELDLKPLPRADSDQLLESMAGVLPAEILSTVWSMAAGNPFVSSAVLRGLVEGHVLTPATDGWEVDHDQLRNLQMSGEAAGVLTQRLTRLSAESRQLLSVGAVLGREFAIETAVAVSQLSYQDVVRHLEEPRECHLIWEKAANGNCQFVHDQIREAVLASIESDELMRIHRAAGDYLSRTSPDSHFEIACHYDAAKCPDKAYPASVKAATAARERHALEIAELQYSIALRCCSSLRIVPSFELLNGMGSVLMLAGRYTEAEPMLRRAQHQTDSVVSEAEIILKLGELAFKRDDKDEAVGLWESALRKLGGQLPSAWLMPVFTLKEIAVQTLHSFFPRTFVRSRTREASARVRLICRIYSRLAYGYWYLKGKIPLLFVHLRGMNIAERYAPTSELAQAYSEHAPAMSLIPLRNRGIAYGRRSLEIRTALDDVWGQGQSLHFLAIALYAAGRFEECIEVGQRSVRILDRAGDFWEKHIAQYQVAASLYRVGRLADAVEAAREAYDSGLAVGDDQVCGNIIDVWARATNGDLPEDIVRTELERPRADLQGRAHVLLARGVQLFGDGQFQDAAATFAEGISISSAAGITNCYTAPLYAWKATAVRSFLEEESPVIRKSRQKTICDHRSSARRAVWIALRFRSDLPHALRELAWSFIFLNEVRRAKFALRWSIREAACQGARYEQLHSEQMLARICAELREPDAAARLAETEQRMATFQNDQLPKRMPTSLSLVDRFDSLLESGRKIASSTDPEEIVSLTMTASQHLLRSDFCRLVSIGSDGRPLNVAESMRPTVVDCMNSGEAEFAEAPTRDFRSLIACPVFVRGSAVACLVVGNSEVRGLFGDNEQRIVSYIATICGAALENADGFNKLRQLNENLENMVAERTATIEARSHQLEKTADHLRETQAKLAAARDAAEVASQAKSDFLAHMSHEIRTPIGAVLGFTEILLKGSHPLHPDQKKHLERVHSNGAHLLQLLNDVLDLSKIEAGELRIERDECRPFALLTDILESLQSRAVGKGLRLSLTVEDAVPQTIVTDSTRLRQIVTNLVGNAIKFTSEGAIDLIVGVSRDDELLKIAVRDTGVGIDPEAQSAIFEPFQQADVSVNRRFGGTGLGLSISRNLAQALGGDIFLQSTPGEGSTFSVTIATGSLESVRMLSLKEAASDHAEAESQLPEYPLAGYRILVADDVDANRQFLSHTLTKAGAEVHLAENGQEAMDTAMAQSFDLILMDMRMPILDGHDATAMLRARGVAIPIVALTANGLAEDEIRCREAGCSGYLTKPISMEALLAGVAGHLGMEARQDEQVSDEPPLADSSIPSAHSDSPSQPAATKIDQHSQCAQERVLTEAPVLPDDPFLRELSEELVVKLIKTLPESLRLLTERDAGGLANQGHWMKGTGGTVGLPAISAIGLALEQRAKNDDFEGAANVVKELGEVIGKLHECSVC